MLAKQTDKKIQLCITAPPPPGWAMQFNADPSNVPDAAPTNSELRVVVGQLHNGRVSGATGMKAKHLKEWLVDMKRDEMEDGVEGTGDRWWSYVALLQVVWESRSIPTQMTWIIVVLLPKGRGRLLRYWRALQPHLEGRRELAPPCAGPCGPCTHRGQRRGLKLCTGPSVS